MLILCGCSLDPTTVEGKISDDGKTKAIEIKPPKKTVTPHRASPEARIGKENLLRVQADLNDSLVQAAYDGNVAKVKQLVKRGVNPNVAMGFPPVRGNNQKLVKQDALARGVKYSNTTPLMAAVWGNRSEVVKFLLTCGADPNRKSSPDGRQRLQSPLSVALSGGEYAFFTSSDTAIALLSGGANAKEKISIGEMGDYSATNNVNMLMIGAATGSEVVVKSLIKHGSTVNAKDGLGRTALMYSSPRGAEEHIAVAQVLLSQGAQINARDVLGRTALMHLLLSPYWRDEKYARGLAKVINFYKGHGADINVIDKHGQTIQALVSKLGNPKAKKLLGNSK